MTIPRRWYIFMVAIFSAGAMAMSSLTVVSNSLLLGRYKPRFTSKKHDRHEEGILGETYVRPASPKA